MKRLIFLMIVLVGFLTSCKENPGGNDNECDGGSPCLPPIPTQVGIMAPTASETYWTDQSIPCVTNEPNYADQTTWLVGKEGEDAKKVSCTDGKLDTTLVDGKHKVTARIASDEDDENAVEQSVTITVMEAFSVTLDKPKSDAEFFVRDKVACEATIEPANKYEEYLQITVDGKDCTDGEIRLEKAGELTVRAFANIDGRTEADEAVVTVKPVIAGRILPLTDTGVVDARGFTVRLEASGQSATADVAADGSFAIRADFIDELGGEDVTISVSGREGEFYPAQATVTGEELLALVESDELGFVLAPRRWTIHGGPLAGQSTSIKLDDAFDSGVKESDSNFYKLRGINRDKLAVIHPDRPVKTVFDHIKTEDNGEEIAADDSTGFWDNLETLEDYVDLWQFFIPAPQSEVSDLRDGFIVEVDPSATSPSVSGLSFDDDFFIEGGYFKFPKVVELSTSIAMHEGGHALGFGHTCRWPTMMTTNKCSDGGDSDSGDRNGPSLDDVVHIQLAYRTVVLQYEERIAFGLVHTEPGRKAVAVALAARS